MHEAVNEEVEVINSIYENTAEYSESLSTVDLQIPDTQVRIRLWLPGQYPEEPPRVAKISGVPTDEHSIERVQKVIEETFIPGEIYMFSFIDEVRNEAEKLENARYSMEKQIKEQEEAVPESETTANSRITDWVKSDEVRDRGSTFIGRALPVSTEDELNDAVTDLLSDKKISQAQHNMIAWRISLNEENTLFSQDFDNDGEAGAGTSMLNVLQMSNAINVVVVVSRYFSGTHIGPDRFRHIKNCTKDALMKGKFVNK